MIRFVSELPASALPRLCGLEDCEAPHRARNRCAKHLQEMVNAERRASGLRVSDGARPRNMKREGKLCETGCGRPVHARGFCHSCYKSHAPRKPCKTDGCSGRNHAQGFCHRCYGKARTRREIDVVRPVGKPINRRFAESVTVAYSSCQVWTGHVDPNGQGRFTPEGGQVWGAHRWAWAQQRGVLPRDADGKSLPLDHMCRVRNCVNVDHLEPVTQEENMRRAKVAAGSPITEKDTRWFFTALAAWANGADNFPKSVSHRVSRVRVIQIEESAA